MKTDALFDKPDDFYGAEDDPFERPDRTEDRVPRDGNDWPRILPPGMVMPDTMSKRDKVLRSYMRPSGAGDILDNRHMLELWYQRKAAEGTAMSKTLQLEWAAVDPEDRRKQNGLVKKALELARTDESAREGTAVHALTERHDLGLPIRFLPDEYERDIPAWIGATKDFKILDVECFVVEDMYRAAGTFDRLVYYWIPCDICGKHNRILDLKTGRSAFGKAGMAMQLGIYAHGRYYDPSTGLRTDLPDVCLCRGIIVRLPAGSGEAHLEWINIGQAWEKGLPLRVELQEYQAKKNWAVQFETQPDFTPEIEACNTRDELNAVWHKHRSLWLPQHTLAGENRMEQVRLLAEGI
jgi:hypothetical protein